MTSPARVPNAASVLAFPRIQTAELLERGLVPAAPDGAAVEPAALGEAFKLIRPLVQEADGRSGSWGGMVPSD